MIKAILFDASETLIRLPRGVAAHYREVAARHGLQVDEAELAAAFRDAWKTMPAREATMLPRPDDDRGWWRELVQRVFGERVASPVTFEPLFSELYQEFTRPGVWELFEDVAPVLAHLREQYRLGIVSNFDRRLHVILRQLGMVPMFDAVTISSETGADKPHPFIFAEALRRLEVNASEAIHVGDDPIRDWAGAQSAGIRAFHLERPRNSLRDLLPWLDALH